MKKISLCIFLIPVLGLVNLKSQTYNNVTTFAGNGTAGLVNGPLANAEFQAYNLCSNPATGTLYVADTHNNAIRKISNGMVTTLAGNGTQGDVDAQGANARFFYPSGICYYNGYLYITDNGNNKIKRIDTLGNSVTYAGTGVPGFLNGTLLTAKFYNPTNIVPDNSGGFYVSDYFNDCIRHISGGSVTTYAGVGATPGDQLGPVGTALFDHPSCMCLDGLGNMYVTDLVNNKVKFISGGNVTLLAGSGAQGFTNGTGSGATFYHPGGVVMDHSGNIIINDGGNNVVRKITPAGVTTTLAGNGTPGFVNGPVASAEFNNPAEEFIDPNGQIYVGDVSNNVIRLITLAFSAQITSTNISCFGSNSGTATATPIGGTSPYTYSWAPSGGTNATASGLAPGTYTCTITDANSNSYQQTVTITQPTQLSTSITSSNILCFGNTNGSATVSASGGTPGYTYSWSPSGGTNATATGLGAATYTCIITDANGCTNQQVANITQPTQITATAISTNLTCYGGNNASASVAVSGGTPGYTYNWSPSGGTNATANGLSAASYSCVITDANGCAVTQIVTITQPSQLSATAISTGLLCYGNNNASATVAVSGGTPGYTYNWAPSGGTGATASGLSSGTYTCTITDANGCTNQQTVTITQPPQLSSSITSVNPLCFGNNNASATVAVSGGTPGYNYSWSPSGGTNATATGLSASNYTCTITDANGCTTQQSVTITQPAQLSGTAISTNLLCYGGNNASATVAISGGTPGYNYSWSPSGGNGQTATGLSSGNYTCTITDANGCAITQSVTVTQPTQISASSISTGLLCFGNTNASASVAVSGGTPGYTYNWSPTGGNNQSATGLGAGSYTCTITDANGCTNQQSVTITQPLQLSASGISTSLLCFGNTNASASVAVSGGTPGYTYSWSPTGGTNQTANGLAAGTYTVTVTDANGCVVTDLIDITQPNQLTATASHTDESLAAANDGTATATPSGGTPGYTYSWAPTGGTSQTATGLDAGTYTCTITDANGCTTTVTVTVGTTNGVGIATVSDPDFSVNLFPNPAQDYIQLSVTTSQKENVILEIFNITGEKIDEIDFGNVDNVNYAYNTLTLANGVYFARISSGAISTTRKITVLH